MKACAVLLAAGILLLCGPACSTMLSFGRDHRYLYSGTCQNINAFVPPKRAPLDGDPDASPAGYAFNDVPPGFAFLDFPCSLVLDTVLLPLSLPLELLHGGSSSPPPERAGSPKKE